MHRRRKYVIVFIVLLIVLETAAYVGMTPRSRYEFFELYVLGPDRLSGNYFPYGNPSILPRELVKWYLGVENQMGSVQLMTIRVRLGNETVDSPDDSLMIPSSAPLVMEIPRFLENNSTFETPFFWRILNATPVGESSRILELQVNNSTYQIQGVDARRGYNFRIIFELWTYDVASSAFIFGWSSSIGRRAAWLQVWFNMTATSPV